MRFFFISCLIFSVALSGCKTAKTADDTARSFIDALNSKSYAKARSLSTSKTHDLLQIMQTMTQMQGLFGGGSSKKFADVTKMKCVEKGNVADCAYCCNEGGQNTKMRLVREKDKWLVDMGKESVLDNINLDLGGNMPKMPDAGGGNMPNFPEISTEMPNRTADRAPNDSLALPPSEVALRFADALVNKDYFELQNLSSDALHARISQSLVAENVLRDTNAVQNNAINYVYDYKNADCKPRTDTETDCVCKAKNKADIALALTKGYDAEWRVTNVVEPTKIPQPDQTKPESVAAYFITYLLNGSWDDAEAISTPETARTITFLTRTAMNRPESFDELAKLRCMVNAERASCAYCCNPLNNEDTIILVKKDGKWWVDWRLK